MAYVSVPYTVIRTVLILTKSPSYCMSLYARSAVFRSGNDSCWTVLVPSLKWHFGGSELAMLSGGGFMLFFYDIA